MSNLEHGLKRHIASLTTNPYFYRGRVGLFYLLKEIGITNNSRVAIQAFTCVAVVEPLLALGAMPVYIDTAQSSLNIDTDKLAYALKEGLDAVILQHTFGLPAELNTVIELCNKYNVPVIEDCCHSIMSFYEDKPTGTLSIGAFWSFEWGKPLVGGLGGLARFNKEDLQVNLTQQAKLLRKPGLLKEIKLFVQLVGYILFYSPVTYWWIRRLYRFLSRHGVVEGSFLEIKKNMIPNDYKLSISRVTKFNLNLTLRSAMKEYEIRKAQTELYFNKIKNDKVRCFISAIDSQVSFVRFPLWCTEKSKLLENANEEEMEVAAWFETPVHPLKGEALESIGYKIGSCINAEKLCSNVVTLPLGSKVSMRYQEKLINFINSFK